MIFFNCCEKFPSTPVVTYDPSINSDLHIISDPEGSNLICTGRIQKTVIRKLKKLSSITLAITPFLAVES